MTKLNSKAMIADLELESPIFFDNIKRKSNFKNLEAIIKAIELNNGAGLNETSEILAFFYQNNSVKIRIPIIYYISFFF